MSIHINLALVFHQHQPVGNYGFVFEELFEKSYDPLLSCIERHPGVRVGLHYSGPLIDWLLENQPDYIARVRALVQRGQVEALGGGYYEPALPAISERDRIGQLTKMRRDVARLFGKEPTGAWLAERVWEPSFPTALAASGYTWTIVDDVHFAGAGVHPDQLNSWYLTEAEGETVGVFGSNTRFRYLVPWGTVDDCINFLRDAGDREPGSLVAMGDDGEKFGGWPTTYLHCWENGWVDSFFARLEAESHWIGTVHLGDWRRQHPPKSLVYLPATSYMEMGEWSLPPEGQHDLERAKAILRAHGGGDLEPMLRGGHWRNFLVRYPEVNLLHKRSLHLSRDAHRLANDEALDQVWQAQCNCPFWHGVFGGVYLENIRNANFGHLAHADALLHPGTEPPDIRDWDYDGVDEVCLRSAEHLAIVAPARGGRIEQWDLRQRAWNMTHVVARRPEAYHAGLGEGGDAEVRNIHDSVKVKDPEVLRRGFQYDRGLRLAAQDTIIAPGAGQDDHEAARECQAANICGFVAEGQAMDMSLELDGATVGKRIIVDGALTVRYEWRADETRRLCSEWNLSLPSGPEPTPEFIQAPGRVEMRGGGLTLVAEHNAEEVWMQHIESASNTEGGVELAPQGWAFVFARNMAAGGAPFVLRWSVAE
jgi:alpha-amylase